jgi:hypothetical protein
MNNNPDQQGIPNGAIELSIDFNNLTINKAEIESTLGYSENEIPFHFSAMIDNIIQELPDRCIISAGYSVLEMQMQAGRNGGITIGNKYFKTDKIIAGQIKNSEWIAVFVSTIGPEMEKWSKQLLVKGDTVMCYLVDTIASIVVENVTNYVHDYIEEIMSGIGMKITNRYSPGYCNWPVSEQQLLFSLLPPDFCGIKLTESSMMIPVKSVSGIIGIGHRVKRREYICEDCGVKDCIYRATRAPRSKNKSA